MPAELIINSDFFETRVALVENGQIAELYVERSSDRGITGNIYKGRVVRVLPGMQAAFVDINLEKAAFLYVSDIHHPMGEIEQLLLNSCEGSGESEPSEEPAEPSEQEFNDVCYLQKHLVDIPIEDRLQEGQEILVQVA